MSPRLALLVLLVGCGKQAPVAAGTAGDPEQAPPAQAEPPTGIQATLGLFGLEARSGEPVTLGFGWTAGDEAAVTHAVIATQVNGDMLSSRTRTDATWTETLAGSKDGLRYAQRDGEATTEISPPPPAQETMEAVMSALAVASAETVLDEQGGWVGVDGVDAKRSEVAYALAPLFEELPGPMQAALEASLSGGLSDAVVSEESRTRWEALVGAWSGTEWAPDEARKELLDGGQTRTTRFLGWAPCVDGGPPDCVLLEREMVAGEVEIALDRKRVLDALNTSWPMDRPMPELTASELDTTERLLTRPDTLRPVAWSKRKTALHTLVVEGRPIPWGRELRMHTTWSWTLEAK